MGGGPSTAELVVAASDAGALGFLAAGYKTAAAMRAEIDAVAAATDQPFGVNVFVPGAPAAVPEELAAYLSGISAEAERLGVKPGEPAWDDDDWEAKLAALLARPPAVISFTFGCPGRDVITAFQAAGSLVCVTVTSPQEAATATAADADCLCVQGAEAGAHRGTFTNGPDSARDYRLPQLLRATAAVTDLPLIAAGAIMTHEDVTTALAAGAVAAQCGTAFLRCPESGAQPLHKAALADPRFTRTAVTRAFSGRPARGLVNRFMLDHPDAPAAYPEINNATRPLRAAAVSAGERECMSLWAGEGYRAATIRPAAEIVDLLRGR
jgi:nitronate monooxygenase